MKSARVRLLLTSAFLASCAGSETTVSNAPWVGTSGAAATAPALVHSAGGLDAREQLLAPELETHVAVVEPGELAALERLGFSLGVLLRGRELSNTETLNRDAGFKSIFDVLRADLVDTKAKHPGAKVTSVDGVRLFDAEWLASKRMSFELTGVFNRLDRRAFYQGTCGEVRFLYRLGYETEQGKAPMKFRLPMTLNVVFLVRDADCRATARAWQSEAGPQGESFAAWLVDAGPLGEAARRHWSLKSVEANVQSVRLQSSMRPSMAGHIEYVMRVFEAADPARARFVPRVMENMPDVALLRRDAALRAELLAFLRQPAALAALDDGVLLLPERFLARRAVSVAPRGLARQANRPFRQLFTPADFADLDLGATRTLRSPTALLRRLDGHSCVGCHQSRSIAGFHHVGNDPEWVPPYASLLSGLSAHLRADLARRRDYVSAVAAAEVPIEHRPAPERQGVGNQYGAPCGLGDPGLADWTCAPGYRCVKLEDSEVGACFAEGSVGAPCEYGDMLTGAGPARDQVAHVTKSACGQGLTCVTNFSGFPQGSCDASCGGELEDRACGDFLDVDAFQNCLRFRQPVAECATRHVFKTGMRACDDEHPCRQDFVCSRVGPNEGACMPPYFVYPLRLDGYPLRR